MALHFLIIGIAVVILIIAVGAIIISGPAREESKKLFEKTGKHPKGYYTNLGMAFGIALGLPIGVAIGMPGIGPALGLPIGLAIGTAWEKKNEDKLRPLTKTEEEVKKKMVLFLIATAVIGLIAFAAFFLFS
jgi:hypothetical protein